MDPSNWMATHGANRVVGETTMESGDWKASLQRQMIVNKIMDTLKRCLPFSAYDRLQELKKIAERVENQIFTAATSQSEYTRKTCYMMLTMETRLQNYMSKSESIRSNSAVLYNIVNPLVSFDLTAHMGNPNGGNWQEEVYQQIKAMKDLYLLDLTAQSGNPNGEDFREEMYQKIKAMKDLYLEDLNTMHQRILSKLQQHVSHLHQLEHVQLEKLKVFQNMLEFLMQFLKTPKHAILSSYKDALDIYEKQIIIVINSYRRHSAPPQQTG